MYTETEGIILRQTKIVGGRRMISLFSKKYGKISAGSNLNEKGRSKSALAMRPFTYGRYELYKKGDYFNINGAETLQSYYTIGEDVDKYMHASYCLELADKLLVEGQPAAGFFNLTKDLLEALQKRRGHYMTLVLAYQMKALKLLGVLAEPSACVSCGTSLETEGKKDLIFSVPAGGLLCENCREKSEVGGEISPSGGLIYQVDFGIVDVLNYFLAHPLESLENLTLAEENEKTVRNLLREYLRYHLDIDQLKSEDWIGSETRR